MRRLLLGAALALCFAGSAAAQGFPITVKLGIDPDTSASPALGYFVTVNGGTQVDMGLPPVTPNCQAFVGSAVAPCVLFSVSIPAAGSHTVSVVAYNLDGNSAPATITFTAPTSTPSAPTGVKVIK